MDHITYLRVKGLQASFQVADALDQPFPDGQFDLVWSMESGEHMPDKAKVYFLLKFQVLGSFVINNGPPCSLALNPRNSLQFVNELVRVAAPGATIILVTWCHRDLGASEKALKPEEKRLLDKICNAFYLPAWCSTADYVQLLQSLSLQVFTCSKLAGRKLL